MILTGTITAVLVMASAAALDDHPAFQEGRRLYEASEYEQATFRFQEAALDPAIVVPAEKAQVFMWLGLAYAGFGDAESARRAFRDAFRLDESVAVPVEISPKVEAEIAAVRDEARANKAKLKAEAEAEADAKVVATEPANGAPPANGAAPSWVLPVVVGAAGAACVVGSVVSAALAVSSHNEASDLETFQDDVPALVATRDTQAAVAVGLGGIGAALVGGAVFFAFE